MTKPDIDDYSFDKFSDNLTDRLFEDMITKAMTLVFKLKGLSTGVGNFAYAKIYAEYAKKVLDLWREERRYHDSWMKYAGLTSMLMKSIEEVSQLREVFNPKKLNENSLVSLFTLNLDRRVATEIRAQNKRSHKRISNIIELLDRVAHENRKFIARLADEISDLDRFLEKDNPTSPFDISIGNLPLKCLREDVCREAGILFKETNRLIERRNEWAALLGRTSEPSLRRTSFNDNCATGY